jgi:hypothetical protein
MPYCPNCRTEYTSGAAICADCGAALIETPPEGWRRAQRPEGMRPVEVAEAENLVELDLMEAQLRAAGIPTARRPRRVALFVVEANREAAQRVLSGKSPQALPETFGLSELHRIRLVCEECEQAMTVDLLTERVPEQCQCGRYFDLSAARPILDRYADLMRVMADAEFEIEIVVPEAQQEDES